MQSWDIKGSPPPITGSGHYLDLSRKLHLSTDGIAARHFTAHDPLPLGCPIGLSDSTTIHEHLLAIFADDTNEELAWLVLHRKDTDIECIEDISNGLEGCFHMGRDKTMYISYWLLANRKKGNVRPASKRRTPRSTRLPPRGRGHVERGHRSTPGEEQCATRVEAQDMMGVGGGELVGLESLYAVMGVGVKIPPALFPKISSPYTPRPENRSTQQSEFRYVKMAHI